ncbi:MAG: aldo/keto reductase [Planctomycetota bacterium]|nr:aldo/keto reductase [Planctomycetota bacterium]
MPPAWSLTASLAPDLPPVCRLGLATRGDAALGPDDVHYALSRGVNYLNWCGRPDGLSRAVRELDPAARAKLVLAAQLSAYGYDEMKREFEAAREALGVERLDVPTFYWMESREQWNELTGPRGGYRCLKEAQARGEVRLLGLTSHQRKLAAEIAAEGTIDLLMIRYNAAHAGAEREIFPVAGERRIPVVAYTCLRWGALPRPTPDDPPGFAPPPAPAWYRWALQHPGVAVAIMAPASRAELDADLALLDDPQPLDPDAYERLSAHGLRVRKHAGRFP